MSIHTASARQLSIIAGLLGFVPVAGWSFWSAHSEFIPIELILSLLLSVCVFGLVSIRRLLMEAGAQQMQTERWALRRLQSALYIQNAAPDAAMLLNFGGMAIEPDFAAELVRILRQTQPRLVVELGSGVSTVLTAMILREQGGRLISIDHDSVYADLTRQQLVRLGLENVAEVRTAPLREVTVDGKLWQWYDTSLLQDLQGVDLLVVDGPPGWLQPQSRYPALPLFYDLLSATCTVLVDDSAREDEQALVSRWIDRWPEFTRFELHSARGATHLARNRS